MAGRLGVDCHPQILPRISEALAKCRSNFSGFSASELSPSTCATRNIREWLQGRFVKIGIRKDDKIVCVSEAPLEIDGLVLNFFSLDVRRPLKDIPVQERSLVQKAGDVARSFLDGLVAETVSKDDESLLLPGEQMPPVIYSAESESERHSNVSIPVARGTRVIVTAMSPDLDIDGGRIGRVSPLENGRSIEICGPSHVRLHIHDLVAGIFIFEFLRTR